MIKLLKTLMFLVFLFNFRIGIDFGESTNLPSIKITSLGTNVYADMPPDCGQGAIYVCGYYGGNPHLRAYSNGWVAIP